jgi:hypothetical protein
MSQLQVWHSAGDSRVRPEHAALDEDLLLLNPWRMAQPPALDDGKMFRCVLVDLVVAVEAD